MSDDFIWFAIVGMATVFFFTIGLPVILAYRLMMKELELKHEPQ